MVTIKITEAQRHKGVHTFQIRHNLITFRLKTASVLQWWIILSKSKKIMVWLIKTTITRDAHLLKI